MVEVTNILQKRIVNQAGEIEELKQKIKHQQRALGLWRQIDLHSKETILQLEKQVEDYEARLAKFQCTSYDGVDPEYVRQLEQIVEQAEIMLQGVIKCLRR